MIKRRTLILYLLIVALLTGAYAVWRTNVPRAQGGSKTITVNIDHLAGEDRTYTIRTGEEYLRGALEQENLIEGTESEYGLYVLTVDGETADESGMQWWGYNVNGTLAEYGVDGQVVTDGDVYDFTLNVGW